MRPRRSLDAGRICSLEQHAFKAEATTIAVGISAAGPVLRGPDDRAFRLLGSDDQQYPVPQRRQSRRLVHVGRRRRLAAIDENRRLLRSLHYRPVDLLRFSSKAEGATHVV